MVSSIVLSLALSGFLPFSPAAPRHYVATPAIAASPMFASPFVSKDGRFSINLPDGFGKPTLESQDVPSELGPIKLHMHTALGSDGVCLVGYSDISNVEFTDELREKMLEGAKEGAIENMNAKLESESTITIDGRKAKSVRFSMDAEGQTMHGQFNYVMDGNRLYQIGYIALTDNVIGNAAVQDYFSSFKITSAANNAKPAKGKKK